MYPVSSISFTPADLVFTDNCLLMPILFLFTSGEYLAPLQCCNLECHSAHTLMHCSARSRLFLEAISTTTSLLHRALMAPSTQTIRRVHSADTSR